MPNLHDTVSPPLQAARSLWNAGRQEEALRRFEQVVSTDPDNVRAAIDTAGAYAIRFEFELMERHFRRLVDRAPDHAGVHHLIGELYTRLKLPQKALASFERGGRCSNALPDTLVEAAAILERAGRLDDAQELLDHSLRVASASPAAVFLQGRLAFRRGDLDSAIRRLRQLLADVTVSAPRHPLVPQIWGELATLLDRQQDFAGAWDANARCKELQRQDAMPHAQGAKQLRARAARMLDTIGSEDFSRWFELGTNDPHPPVALLTGFPRSGTTLLEQVLDAHPDILASEERDFLGKQLFWEWIGGSPLDQPIQESLRRIDNARIQTARDRYLVAHAWLAGESIQGRCLLDKNPTYNLFIPLALRLFPRMRIITALRDPRDVVLSCHLRYLALNSVSVCFLTLEDTVARYLLDMGAWLKFRDWLRTPWTEVRYEETVADLPATAERAIMGLGLPWDATVLGYRTRLRNKIVNSPTYEAVEKPIHHGSIGRWRHYEPWLRPVLDQLAPMIGRLGYDGPEPGPSTVS